MKDNTKTTDNPTNPEIAHCKISAMVGFQYFTIEEVAQFLRVSDATVRRLIDEEKLECDKVRHQIRITEHHLRDYFSKIAA